MNTLIRTFFVTASLAVAVMTLPFAPALEAQATLTQTTLSAALTKSGAVAAVTSATGVADNYVVVVDSEAMIVNASWASGTQLPVQRGALGTVAAEHASGAVAFIGRPTYFSKVDPVGPCTATNEVALPRVVIGTQGALPPAVSVYDCAGASATTQRWQQITRNGYPAAVLGSTGGTQAGVAPPTYTGAGAITILPGLQFIGSAGALAMTLANPALYQSGTVMVLQASTAQIHTITYTAGFFGNTTASDVCTFGGAIGDSLTVVAQNGAWRAIATRNCTLA